MFDEKTKNLLISRINKLLPRNEQNKLISAMRYMLLAPAKYIRPFLVIHSFQIFNTDIREILPVAIAVELIHTYSLIHDDLPCMDNSDTRRGQDSCHKKFGEALAVLAGDSLLTLAFEILSSLEIDSDKRCKVIKALSKAVGPEGMVEGQVLDIENQHMDSEKIKEIHLLKTARLFAASCEIGAIMGNATDEQQKALRDYGKNLGLMFQAKDDMKDCGQDETNNLVSILGKDGVKSYIEELFQKASHNLDTLLSESTSPLYNLLKRIKEIKEDG